MSSSFKIKYKDIYELTNKYKNKLETFKKDIDLCSRAVTALINDYSFSGAAADAIKNYLNEVHLTLHASLKAAAQNMLDNIALYKASYYSVDASTNFVLNEDAMRNYSDELQSKYDNQVTCSNDVKGILNSISDIFYRKNPSMTEIVWVHDGIQKDIKTTIQNVNTLEAQTVKNLANSTSLILDYLKKSISAIGSDLSGIMSYEKGSFYTNPNVYTLANLSEYFYQQHEQNKEVYENIWEYENELEEAAKERETEGIWKTVGGAGLVITGTLCIVFTAGAATPVVVAAGAAIGGGTVAFGISDAVEGGQEIYYGKSGDLDSVSINAIRDTVFMGNEEVYRYTEGAFAFAASVMIPVGKMESVTVRSVAVAAGKEAISSAAGAEASKITMEYTGSRVASIFAGMGAGALAGLGLDALDSKLSISAGPKKSTAKLLRESTCSDDELYRYLLKNKGADAAEEFLKNGIWPDDVQIPKESSFIASDGKQNWGKAPKDGYTLDADGNAVKESFIPKEGEIFDRYGSSDGRYVSPINGKPYSYGDRSLPYVEDVRQLHRYEVTGDFTKLEEYVNNCTDPVLKADIQDTVNAYYNGDYSKVISQKGIAAPIDGWGNGGAIQWEFGLKIEALEKLGLIKEIEIPSVVVNTVPYTNPYININATKEN